MYLLFSPLTILSYFKQRQKEKISFSTDKRLNWNAMRFDDTRDIRSFWKVMNITRQGGLIAYENTMEVSVRGYNLINNFKGNFPLVIKLHLLMSFIANKIFPDLYLKRRGLSLADESNNHRFYNLLFEALFQKTFFDKTTNLKLFRFVEDRLDDNGFLNEGASFYHLGILWALKYTMEAHKITPPNWHSLKKLAKAIDLFDKNFSALVQLNFGDRDDTLVAKSEFYEYLSKNGPHELSPVPGQYFIKSKSSQSLYIRLGGEINFGTGGHFHDDFGHMTLFQGNNKIMIPDPGIFLYDNEPNLCLSTSHNLPTPVHEVSMVFRSRFTRAKIAKERAFVKDNELNIQKIYLGSTVARSISQKHDFIEVLDFAESNRSQSYKTSFLICNAENSDAIEFDGESGLVKLPTVSFQFFGFEKIELEDSFYCPQYGKKLTALNLKGEWNFESKHSTKLLEVIIS